MSKIQAHKHPFVSWDLCFPLSVASIYDFYPVSFSEKRYTHADYDQRDFELLAEIMAGMSVDTHPK